MPPRATGAGPTARGRGGAAASRPFSTARGGAAAASGGRRGGAASRGRGSAGTAIASAGGRKRYRQDENGRGDEEELPDAELQVEDGDDDDHTLDGGERERDRDRTGGDDGEGDDGEGDDGEEDEEEGEREKIPAELLTRILYEFFEREGTRITRDANAAVARYVDVFVREAIARAAVERRGGFLEVEDLEKIAPQLLMDL